MQKKPLSGDEEVDRLVLAAARASVHKIPDTVAARIAVPDAFTRLADVAGTRVWILTEAARFQAAPHVEFATRNARVAMIDEFHIGETAIADNARACAGRAHARRLDLVEQVWQAEQRVESLTLAHAATLEALRRQFHIYLGLLDAAIRSTRNGKYLTYATPTDVDIPADAFDVGLTRVRAALAQHVTTRHDDPADNGTTEKGAA